MAITYAIMAVVSFLLLAGCIVLLRSREKWLVLLYTCVCVVNLGYFLLSVSRTLEMALLANKLSYLGSVFLPMCMLMIIVRLCGFPYKKRLPVILLALGLAMFAVICTTGVLPWYYREVKLIFVDGAAKLEKVYGVLHPVYLVYLVGYFAAMIACIFHSYHKKLIASQRHAALMAAVVFGNIAVWFVEKFIPWDFEFLAVSYLFSELVFLGLYWMIQDYVRAERISVEAEPAQAEDAPWTRLDVGETLTAREKEILTLMLQDRKRKEIAELLHLSENTIKTHTRTLYGKLGVNSREELHALVQEK
ncbi:MAG: hypothetical protein J6B67_00145 [Oscillospiraceae bacterium]|nr:hypothetical protein [Oscillospiraceae bacterium]